MRVTEIKMKNQFFAQKVETILRKDSVKFGYAEMTAREIAERNNID